MKGCADNASRWTDPEESCARFPVLQAFASFKRTFWESFQEWFKRLKIHKSFMLAKLQRWKSPTNSSKRACLRGLHSFKIFVFALQSFWSSHLVEHGLRASILYQAGSQQPFRLTTCHLRGKQVFSGHQYRKLEAIGAGIWSKNWLSSHFEKYKWSVWCFSVRSYSGMRFPSIKKVQDDTSKIIPEPALIFWLTILTQGILGS